MERKSTSIRMETDRKFKPNIIKKRKKHVVLFNTFRNLGKVYAADQEIRPFKTLLLFYKKIQKH